MFTNIILSIIFFPLLFMALRRFYIYNIRHKKLYGEDRNMKNWELILKKPNYVPMIFDFNNMNNDDLDILWKKIIYNLNNEL